MVQRVQPFSLLIRYFSFAGGKWVANPLNFTVSIPKTRLFTAN
nr:MAG TPA: hypothetical protein [Caudoviricetes sp.]